MRNFLILGFGVLIVGSAVAAGVRVNEIAWMGTTTSGYNEWIELWNDSAATVDLTGWTLASTDGAPTISLAGTIGADGYFLLERTDDDSVPGVAADQIYTGTMGNTGEEFELRDGAGILIDSTPTGAWAGGDNSSKKPLERLVSGGWGTSSMVDGTSRAANSDVGAGGSSGADPTAVAIAVRAVASGSGGGWLTITSQADGQMDFSTWKISNGTTAATFGTGGNLRLVRGGTADGSSKFTPTDATTDLALTWHESPLTDPGSKSWSLLDGTGMTRATGTHPRTEILVVEVALDRDIDGVELLARGDGALQFLELRHNGTRIFWTDQSLEVESGDRFWLAMEFEKIQDSPERWRNTTILQPDGRSWQWESSSRNNLNASSGTLELRQHVGTDWERVIVAGTEITDFTCWAAGTLSATEQNRLAKHAANWSGNCVSVPDLILNESLARTELPLDTGTVADWWRHFNGSPGTENVVTNQPPTARIAVQGTARVHETSLNLTGWDAADPEHTSTDPNGDHDFLSWAWSVDGKSCGDYLVDRWEWRATRVDDRTCAEESVRANPDRIYFNFDAQEFFDVTLTVTDHSGASSSVTERLNRDPFNVGGSRNVFDASLKKWIARELKKTPKKFTGTKGRWAADDDFFDDFLAVVDWARLPEIAVVVITPVELPLRARDKIPLEVRERARKNLGLIFY